MLERYHVVKVRENVKKEHDFLYNRCEKSCDDGTRIFLSPKFKRAKEAIGLDL